MKPTGANVIRWSGPATIIAGLSYALVGGFHPPNVLSSVSTTSWMVVHVLAMAMSIFGMLGLAGVYARQAAKSGWLGLVGYLLLTLWLAFILGFTFVEVFILPPLVTIAPAFVEAWMGMLNGTGGSVDLGGMPTLWLLTTPLYLLGGVVFGIATFRARILPLGRCPAGNWNRDGPRGLPASRSSAQDRDPSRAGPDLAWLLGLVRSSRQGHHGAHKSR
jgi:hypothetical protein